MEVEKILLPFLRGARVCFTAAGLVEWVTEEKSENLPPSLGDKENANSVELSPELEILSLRLLLGLPSHTDIGTAAMACDEGGILQVVQTWFSAAAMQRSLAMPLDLEGGLVSLVSVGGSVKSSTYPRSRSDKAEASEDAKELIVEADPSRERLVKLPHRFETLLAMADHCHCANCDNVPQDAALCLVCGTIVCAFNQSCVANSQLPNMVSHAHSCGAGTGLFLLLTDSEVLLIYADIAALYPSPYLDSHGECDRGLSRGHPLFLNERRYADLEAKWQAHAIGREAYMLSEQDNQEVAPGTRGF